MKPRDREDYPTYIGFVLNVIRSKVMDANVKGNFMENRGWDYGFSSISMILGQDLCLKSVKKITKNKNLKNHDFFRV